MIQTCSEHGWAGELVLGPAGGCPMCKAKREQEEQDKRNARLDKFFSENPDKLPKWSPEQKRLREKE